MAFTKLTTDVEHVQALNDRPNANSGLTADQVKAVFDQAGTDIKTYINNVLTPELDSNSGVSLGIANVKNFGAIGDGVADDTAAVALAYASAVSSKSILYFPGGTFKFNLNVLDSSVRIEGSGRKRRDSAGLLTGGTRFIHADVSLPVLKIGDGITSIYDVSFSGFSIQGDSSTVGSDGIVIKGAYWTNGCDFRVDSCGGDNIRIEEGSAVPTSYVYLNQFVSSYARNGNCVKVTTGVQYTSAVYLSNFSLQGWSTAGCRALWIGNTVNLSVSNGYIQASASEIGNVYLDGSSAKLDGSNLIIDSDGVSDVLVNFNFTIGTPVSGFIRGSILIDGNVKYSDGSVVVRPKVSVISQSELSDPIITTNCYIGDSTKTDHTNEVIDANTARFFANATSVVFDRKAFRIVGKYDKPLQFETNGAFWRNDTTGRLRYRFDSRAPSGDTQGRQLQEVQSGTTASRPTDVDIGFNYFDTTLGKPVWLKTGTTWVDATGTTV